MTLDITAGADAAGLGDFSEKEVRLLVFETAQAFYRPAHDVLVGAHAEDLRNASASRRVPPVFDDTILAPVWTACLVRARAHVSDVLGMDLALVVSTPSPSQVGDAPMSPPGVVN